jgi:hypothetical protein
VPHPASTSSEKGKRTVPSRASDNAVFMMRSLFGVQSSCEQCERKLGPRLLQSADISVERGGN